MRVGDKVLCTKSIYGYDIGGSYYIFSKYNSYTITSLSECSLFLDTDEKHLIHGFDIIPNKDTKFLFSDYFITLKESRKLKLKKISGN